MEQSAVEWLAKELLREHPVLTNHDAIQQAKEMEKQQQDDFAIEFTEWLCDYEITKEQIKTRLEIFKNK